MQDIVKADVFFFVTTIAVVVVSIVLVIALMHAIKIMRDVKHVSEKAREEIDSIVKDVKELRGHVRHQGGRVGSLFSVLGSVFKSKSKREKK